MRFVLPRSRHLPLKERVLVIFNPAARGERALRQRERVAELCAGAEVRLTAGPGDAGELARWGVAAGFDTVVAAGGDGTVNEVVNGLAGAEHVTLGVLPLGTMNVFAAELGIPGGRLRRGWEIIRAGHTRQLDIARANGHHFVQMAGIGFDAQAVAEVDREMKKNLGPFAYVLAAARVAARRPPRLVIEPAEGPAREGCFVLVGNGRFYGGPFAVFREARMDDGLLDVVICKTVTHLDLLRYIQNLLLGTHLALPDVEWFQTARAVIRPAEGERDTVPFEADGELAGCAPVALDLLPGALRVLAPPAKGSKPEGRSSKLETSPRFQVQKIGASPAAPTPSLFRASGLELVSGSELRAWSFCPPR